MTKQYIFPIVEGHGEVAAVPPLIRRWIAHVGRLDEYGVHEPIRAPGAAALKCAFNAERKLGVEYFVGLARRRAPAGILILLDADSSCTASASEPPLGPTLLSRAKAVAADTQIAVVVADPEYEAWFLAYAATVFPGVATAPVTPRRDCKAQVRSLLGTPYREPVEQLLLTKRLPLPPVDEIPTINNRSYRKLCKELARLIPPTPPL